MAFQPLRSMLCLQKALRCVTYSSLIKRPMAYKSSISLETLYPNSSLKLSTPTFSSDPNVKFSGFIPMDKLDITFSASSGPGGQNVNKVHTKVDVRFKVAEAEWIHPDIRNKMMEMHSNKLTKEGYIIVRSDTTRSQQLNLADCLRKLRQIIRHAAETKKETSPETQEKIRQRQLRAARLRLVQKRESSLRRAERQAPTIHDL